MDDSLVKIIVVVGIVFLWLARAFFRVFLSPPGTGQGKPVLPGERARRMEGMLGEEAPSRRPPAPEGLLDHDEPARTQVEVREAAERRAERMAGRPSSVPRRLERTAPSAPAYLPLPRALVPPPPAAPRPRAGSRGAASEAQARVRARAKARAEAGREAQPAGDSVELESKGLLLGLDPEAAFVLKEVLGPPRAHRRLPWGPAVRRS